MYIPVEQDFGPGSEKSHWNYEEFDWEIMPELSVMNEITSQLQSFDIVYTPTGVTID